MGTDAIAYLRVSGQAQIDGDGFPRQIDAIARYAKGHEIDVIETFKDEGVSGTKELADRAGLAALLDRLESNGCQLVLIERSDRLARDLMVGEIILGQFRSMGVTVIAADSGTDLTVDDGDPTRTLIRQVLGAVSEFEKQCLVLKLRAARDRVRRRDGRCEGPRPFGTMPGEDATLERIRRLRRKPRGGDRLSYGKIAAQLDAEGLPSRSGRPWTRSAIHKILTREKKA